MQELSQVLVTLFPQEGLGQAKTQVDPFKYKGALQLVQKVVVLKQVLQFESQVLHILKSEVSPYSLVLVQDKAQAFVPLFPQRGLGHCGTQVESLRYRGELQLVQNVDDPKQVAQLTEQVLHILLSSVSPYSLRFVQEGSQVLVKLFPQLGIGQIDVHTESPK